MMNRTLLSLIATLAAGCSTTSAPAPGAPSAPPASPPPSAATSAPAGSIGVTCRATVAGYKDYTTSTTAPNLDVCSVGGDGMLSLYVKGEGADSVRLSLAGYHGAGAYQLTGSSYFSLTNKVPGGGTNQATQNCPSAACSAVVADASADAGAGQHDLEFAVTCPELCDSDTHKCATTPGGGSGVTWSFRASCRVR
jgi:hypothetical protein